MNTHLATKLRAARNAAKLTQDQVAQRLDVTRGAVTQWESKDPDKRTTPNITQLQKFAEMCGVPVSFLIEDKFLVTDIEHARALHRAGKWQDYPAQVQGDQPLEVPPIAGATVAGPVGVVFHANAPGTPLEERMSDNFPATRLAQRYWQGVEYAVCKDAPERGVYFNATIMAGKFQREIDFLTANNLVEFGSLDTYGNLRRKLGDLLLDEKMLPRPVNKHLLVWSGNADAVIDERARDMAQLCGCQLHVFTETEDAAAYLVKLLPNQ